MKAKPITCAAAPCKSCPYRRDVPSGVWAAVEYEKLPAFDGEIVDQLHAGASGLFMCHQTDGRLCAGWIGTHGPHNLLAMRLHHRKVDPAVWLYVSPVRLFKSGAAAAAHGLRAINRPGVRARRMMAQLLRRAAK